ncbi:MAG TPA: DUF4198 domain-containing protein [Chthoniobacterales bacterium]|nr:DUF4198 domain-containing protein [Chthoniobacterales bacterium]
MRKINIQALAAIASATLAANVAKAHDTWLLPDRFHVKPNDIVTLDLTSGMEFPKLETGPKRERVQNAQLRLAGRVLAIEEIIPGPHSLVFKTRLVDQGVAVVWVQLPSRSLELKPDEVEHYLNEIDPPAKVREAWAKAEPKRWRESYTKHQKTFVSVGNSENDRSWAESVGTYLEIVPEKDPTRLRVEDELPVRVLKNGAPLPDFALNAVAAGDKAGETKRTDSAGRTVFRLHKPGSWLLRGTEIRKSTKPGLDWESDFATMTLHVAASD